MQLSSEQVELRNLVRGYLETHVNSEYLRKRISGGVRHDPQFEQTLSQLGLAQEFGNEQSSLTFFDFAVVAAEIGRSLVPEPLLERLLLDALAKRLLPLSERALFVDTANVTAVAPERCCQGLEVGSDGRVTGNILWAYAVEGSTRLLAFVRRKGELLACLINRAQPDVSVAATTSLDLTTPLSKVSLQNAEVVWLSREATELLQDCLEVAKACEVAGICRRVIDMTAEYVRTREQYGVPIGSFQAVQHKLADAYALSESLEALSRFAAWSVSSSPSQRPLTSRAAIGRACDVGVKVCEACIQAHGGIGFTWEYDLHLFLRRAKVTQAAFALDDTRARELIARAAA
jgi:alkylation response protein AidB-like acyl-CoA dehydrogenase